MRLALISSICLLTLSNCEEAQCPGFDLKKEPDMSTPPPDLSPAPCHAPAAAGLLGTPLVCVDFTNNPSMSDSALSGWTFNVNSMCQWTIGGGALQLADYSDAGKTNMKDCGFTLRSIAAKEYEGQTNLTLAIKQSVDILGPPATAAGSVNYQTANINLAGTNNWSTTGNIPLITTTLQLPTSGLSNYQPTFNLHADTYGGGNMMGWKIQSIAVIASP